VGKRQLGLNGAQLAFSHHFHKGVRHEEFLPTRSRHASHVEEWIGLLRHLKRQRRDRGPADGALTDAAGLVHREPRPATTMA